MSSIDRRQLLVGAGAAAILPAVPARVLIFQAKAVVRMPEPPLEVVPLEGA